MKDAPNMFYNWANDPDVTKYVTWPPHTSIEVTEYLISMWIEQYEKEERINFAVVLKETNELIGGIDVVGYLDKVPVIGYAYSKKHWNKGYATEAAKALIDYLFSIGHLKIYIDAMVDNIGSNKVIQKCGGQLIKQEIEDRPLKGDSVLVNRYVIYKN
jgi:ribosomal-protein-alanine N-acetyltransferase